MDGRRLEYLPVDELPPAPRNPKGHDVELIASSMRRHGFTNPLLLDERTGRLVAGHGRIEALGQMWSSNESPPDGVQTDGRTWLVPVVRGWASIDDAHAEAYLVADNQLTTKGGWIEDDLAELLSDLENLDVDLLTSTGFTPEDLDRMLDRLSDGDGDGDEDDAPLPPVDPQSADGDVYELGPHRLVVGSSANPASWVALMADSDPVACVWTDPPYGVNYTGGTKRAMTIANDTPDGAVPLFADVLEAMLPHLEAGASLYVCAPAGPIGIAFGTVLNADPFRVKQQLTWVKDSLVLGRSDYHYRHEPIYYAQLNNHAGRHGRMGEYGWFGDDKQTSVFEVPKPRRNEHHPTMKPVALIRPMLRNSTRRGDVVAEPFAGSGSTLVACHAEGRVFRGIELDPKYADVVCARWQAISGRPPKLVAGEGERDFTELAASMISSVETAQHA